MMKKTLHNIFTSMAILFVVLLSSGICSAQQYQNPSKGSKTAPASCNKDCPKSVCTISKKTDRMSYGAQNTDIKCVMNRNAESTSCIDTLPIKGGNFNLASPVGRRNGRTHYGLDLGTSGQTGMLATAPADGTITECRLFTGGGRGIIMEHAGSCGSKKFSTVFFHLAAWVDSKGNQYKKNPVGCAGRQVKKGDVVGVVGGSNYTKGKLVDAGQKGAYAIHLHFEIHNASGGMQNLKADVINPLCGDIQKLCGSCPYDIASKCGGLSAEAAAQLSQYAALDGYGTSGESTYIDDDVANAMAKCNLDQYMPSNEDCYFCSIFRVIFNTASTLALKSYSTLAKSIANIVIMAFALWISVTVLRHISSFEVKDPRKMVQEILVQSFRVLIVWLILQGSFFEVTKLTLDPVFNTGMTFAQKITGINDCSDSAPYMQNINGYDKTFSADAKGGLPQSMGKNIICTIKSIENKVSHMMAYGRQAICLSWQDPYVFMWFIPHFPLLLTGITLYLGGLLLLLGFPWCLIDCVLNMCIAAGLAPAAIGAWAFKITGQYLKKIWDFFMNAMFNFVFLSIIIYIIVNFVDNIMNPIIEKGGEGGADFLLHPINGLAYYGICALQVVVACLLGWVFLDEGKNFAKRFANATGVGSGGGIGRSVGGAFAQAAKKGGFAVGKAGIAMGKKPAHRFIATPIRKGINKFHAYRTKKKGTAVKDENGNIVGYVRHHRSIWTGFRKTTSRVDIDENGKEVWSRERLSFKTEIGNAITKQLNKYRLKRMQNNLKTGKAVMDKDGNIIEKRNPWYRLGRTTITTATKNADGTYSFSRETESLRMMALAWVTKNSQNSFLQKVNHFANRNITRKTTDLDEKKTAKVYSADHLMTVRQLKDRYGNIVSEDIKFKTNMIQRLTNQDGTINQKVFDKIMQETKFDKATVYRALASEIMKERGIKMDTKFRERKVVIENNVVTVTQTNLDGSVTDLTLNIGGPKSDQMLIDIKNTARNGAYSRIVDNGIMKKEIYFNPDSKEKAATVRYKFADIYYRDIKKRQPLYRDGSFGSHVNKDKAMFGFNQDDVTLHANQIRTGKLNKIPPETGSIKGNTQS